MHPFFLVHRNKNPVEIRITEPKDFEMSASYDDNIEMTPNELYRIRKHQTPTKCDINNEDHVEESYYDSIRVEAFNSSIPAPVLMS